MTEKYDNTGFVANLLTNTIALRKWLLDYFYDARVLIADGKWDDAKARQEFKVVVMESGSRGGLGAQFSEDTIDWESLYNECWETTTPTDDWGKQNLRKRLEKRGVDPDEFGWDLTLTGETTLERLNRKLGK
ncbi:MAG: hypothetical protein ACC700_19600 [Anaerolineales bacterium]